MLVYGNLATGGNIVSASGTIFYVVAAGSYALVPSLAANGDNIMVDNRSVGTAVFNNTATGMGQPSQMIAVGGPSFGQSFRFGSGAWYWEGQYKLSGVL